MAKSFHIITYGCQQNVADSEYITRLLTAGGFSESSEAETADIVLLNTCSVREKPENKVYQKLGYLRSIKRRRPGMIIGVCGCQAQREGEDMRARMPGIDVLVGTAQIERLPDLVAQALETGEPVTALDLPVKRADLEEYDDFPAVRELVPGAQSQLREFVPIMFGCDKFCSFCVVPYTRGRERSRNLPDIVAEVTTLVEGGTKEVTLLGQTVDSWKSPKSGGLLSITDRRGAEMLKFPDLLKAVDAVPGLQRLRFTSPHPKDCTPELIAAMRDLPTVCEWIHMPVQSGSNKVLERMRRGYTRERFLEIIAQLRQAVPDIAITTDVMVGFPGETEQQYEETLSLFEQVQFDGAYMFIYSPRPGTKAFDLGDEVPKDVKTRRLQRLVAMQNRISRQRNEALLGQAFEVLVESSGEKPGQLTGLSRQNKTVHFDGPEALIGETVSVRVHTAAMWGFIGKMEDR